MSQRSTRKMEQNAWLVLFASPNQSCHSAWSPASSDNLGDALALCPRIVASTPTSGSKAGESSDELCSSVPTWCMRNLPLPSVDDQSRVSHVYKTKREEGNNMHFLSDSLCLTVWLSVCLTVCLPGHAGLQTFCVAVRMWTQWNRSRTRCITVWAVPTTRTCSSMASAITAGACTTATETTSTATATAAVATLARMSWSHTPGRPQHSTPFPPPARPCSVSLLTPLLQPPLPSFAPTLPPQSLPSTLRSRSPWTWRRRRTSSEPHSASGLDAHMTNLGSLTGDFLPKPWSKVFRNFWKSHSGVHWFTDRSLVLGEAGYRGLYSFSDICQCSVVLFSFFILAFFFQTYFICTETL